EYSRPQPFLDQADDAPVADTVLREADQPFLAYRIEETGVQYPVHLGAGDPHRQRVQRIVLAAPRPEPIREPEEVLLLDRVQHHDDRALDDPRVKPEDKPYPPARQPPAAAACRPPSGYTSGGTVAAGKPPDGPDHANPRASARGLPRSPATSVHPPRGRHPA